MNVDDFKAIDKDQIQTIAEKLDLSSIAFLVKELTEKDDKLRYNAFLLLQAHSRLKPSVYTYWDELAGKLSSDNSYQRSLGVMLLAENVRWDKEGKFRGVIDGYFACCNDEKFITSRQAIQGLTTIMVATDLYNNEFRKRLLDLDLGQYKENQQKLLKKDITNIVKAIK
jgi:hypothetical protein